MTVPLSRQIGVRCLIGRAQAKIMESQSFTVEKTGVESLPLVGLFAGIGGVWTLFVPKVFPPAIAGA